MSLADQYFGVFGYGNKSASVGSTSASAAPPLYTYSDYELPPEGTERSESALVNHKNNAPTSGSERRHHQQGRAEEAGSRVAVSPTTGGHGRGGRSLSPEASVGVSRGSGQLLQESYLYGVRGGLAPHAKQQALSNVALHETQVSHVIDEHRKRAIEQLTQAGPRLGQGSRSIPQQASAVSTAQQALIEKQSFDQEPTGNSRLMERSVNTPRMAYQKKAAAAAAARAVESTVVPDGVATRRTPVRKADTDGSRTHVHDTLRDRAPAPPADETRRQQLAEQLQLEEARLEQAAATQQRSSARRASPEKLRSPPKQKQQQQKQTQQSQVNGKRRSPQGTSGLRRAAGSIESDHHDPLDNLETDHRAFAEAKRQHRLGGAVVESSAKNGDAVSTDADSYYDNDRSRLRGSSGEDSDRARETAVYKRNQLWHKKCAKERKRLEAVLDDKEKEELTFTPRINKQVGVREGTDRSIMGSRMAGTPRRQHEDSTIEAGHRLYDSAMTMLQKKREKAEQRRLEEDRLFLTKGEASGTTMVSTVGGVPLDSTPAGKVARSSNVGSPSPYTFTPKVRKPKWAESIRPRYLDPVGHVRDQSLLEDGGTQQRQRQPSGDTQRQVSSRVVSPFVGWKPAVATPRDRRGGNSPAQHEVTTSVGGGDDSIVLQLKPSNFGWDEIPAGRGTPGTRGHASMTSGRSMGPGKGGATPCITDYWSHQETTRAYVESQPVHERLYKWGSVYRQHHAEQVQHQQKDQRRSVSVRRSPSPAPLQPNEVGDNSAGFNDFLDRMQEAEHLRRRRLARQAREQDGECSFTPRLNRGPTSTSGRGSPTLSREELEERRRQRRQAPLEEQERELTFKPKLDKHSLEVIGETADGGRARHMTVMDTAAAEWERRMRRREEARQLKEEQETAGITFKPELPTSRHFSPQRNRVHGHDGLAEHAAAQRSRTDKQCQRMRREKEAVELAECTFQPEVPEVPSYLQRITASLSLARGGSSRGASRLEHPPTPHTFGYA